MPSTVRRFSILPLLALAAAGVTACGSSSSSTTASTAATTSNAPVAVAGKSTSVVVNPTTALVLKESGITVAPIAPAKGTTTLVFPVSGGQIVTATLAGTVDHSGGLTVSHGSKSVQVTDPVVNTNTKQLTATIGGKSVPVFDLDLAALKRASGPDGTLIASDITLTLTSEAASALNSSLGVGIFTAGLPFGVATETVAVKG